MLEEKIQNDYVKAMKAKDPVRSGVLSFLRAQMKNVIINEKKDCFVLIFNTETAYALATINIKGPDRDPPKPSNTGKEITEGLAVIIVFYLENAFSA